jgi:hypothetical protein
VFQRAWHLEEVIRELHESEGADLPEQQEADGEESPETH